MNGSERGKKSRIEIVWGPNRNLPERGIDLEILERDITSLMQVEIKWGSYLKRHSM